MHQAGVQPVGVRLRLREARLDLRIFDDPPGRGVHEEHVPGLQAALARDGRGIDVQDTRLGGQHDQSLVGDPEAPGAQAVAVEHRADDGPVCERDVGRAIPGLHHCRVVLVERASRGIHVDVVLPGLRDHHEHRVRQGAPAKVQELDDLIERRGVAAAGRADREEPG